MNVQHAAPEPARRSARRLGMLGATVVVAILATLLGPASPAAATTGVLNGRLQITAPPALPQDLVGASVEVYTLDRQLVTTLTTGAEGRFTWNPAPAGNYKLYFDTNSGSALNGWWSGAFSFDDALTLTIVSGQTYTLGAGVPPASRIVGSASDTTLFELLADAEVTAYNLDGSIAGTATTDLFGNFVVDGLFPNVFYLSIRPTTGGYAKQFWPNATFIEQGTWINLTGSFGRTVTGIDMEFAAGGAVSGIATIAGTGAAASGLSVEVFNARDELVSVGQTGASGQYLVAGLRSGDHYIRFGGVAPSAYKAVYLGGVLTAAAASRFPVTQSFEFFDADIVVELVDTPTVIDRIAGSDRYATAVAVTSAFNPGIPVLYVATGTGFADALSAAAAAVSLDGALLLTDPTQLPANVAAEIVRLAPQQVIVVGGTGVVSASVYSQIAALIPGASVIRRVFGADRYATSRNIAVDAFGSSPSTSAYIADGRNFPDALVASVPAGLDDAPVILVNGAAPSVDADTAALLASLGIATVTIVGGIGAVSDGIRTSIDALPDITAAGRRSGADRYATAIAVNLDVPPPTTVYLATGSGFADALAGAALAGSEAAPIYLVRTTCIPAAVLTKLDELAPTRIVLLGGTGVLSPAVESLTSC